MYLNNIDFKLPFDDYSNVYVVADFDKTITKGSSTSSWGVFSISGLFPKSFVDDRTALYNYYIPIEIDESFDPIKKELLMKEWQIKVFELFKKYNITQKSFNEVITSKNILEFRTGAIEFLEFLNKNNIPLIIMSAGIGNVIEGFLKKNNCLFDNIYISSNTIMFKDGFVDKIDGQLIHSLNKNEISLPKNITEKIQNRKNAILIGDQTTDLNMVSKKKDKNLLTIGFYIDEETTSIETLKSNFDFVFDENEGFYEVLKIVFNKQQKT